MTTLVHMYIGTAPQVPTNYPLTLNPGTTYQDVITLFIQNGGRSGSIYGMQGEVVAYDSAVNLPEFNYILPVGNYTSVYIRDLKGNLTRVPYSDGGTVRDIYNQVQVHGMGRNVRLALQLEDAPLDIGTSINFVLSHGSKSDVPTLVAGKYFSLDTPVRDLNLQPNKVFHLVKYHVGFICSSEKPL